MRVGVLRSVERSLGFLHTMLKAVLSTSFVSEGRMSVSSETVAPSLAPFWVVQ
jgi:hypothetical protein